jgi:hypothetical protein
MPGADGAHVRNRLSERELLWLRVRGALNWRWAVGIGIVLLVVIWLGATGPLRPTCLQARAELSDAQRRLIRDRDRPPEELDEVRARAAQASNEIMAYCGQPKLPDRP